MMIPGLTRLVAPAQPAITLEEAKAHLRVDQTVEDAVIQGFLDAAIEMIGHETGRALEVTQYRFVAPDWSESGNIYTGPMVRMPIAPVRSVEAVSYLDVDGAEQALADDRWYNGSTPTEGRVFFITTGAALPTLWDRAEVGRVQVDFTAGHDPSYPEATGVDPAYMLPSQLRAAVLLMLGSLYENREATVVGRGAVELPLGVERLVRNLRIYR